MKNTTQNCKAIKTIALTLTLLLAASAAALAAGSSSKAEPGEAFELYNRGVELMEKGKFDKAQKKFEAALAEKDDFAEAHNNLAYSLRKQGEDKYAAALEHYNRAIELDPELAQAYMYRGVLHALQGDEEEAKADHARLEELDRDLAEELMQAIATGEEPEGTSGLASKWQGR